MLHETPLARLHQDYLHVAASGQEHAAHRPGAAVGHKVASELEYLPYGPPPVDEHGDPLCQIVASFGAVELEYAALRRGAGMFDSPHRGTLVVTGNIIDRRDFLNRMVTQELKDLGPGMVKSAFWLNRKGRIEADLLILELGERMLIDVDIHQAGHTLKSLSEFLFAEDVQIIDASSQNHHIAVHGKLASEMIAAASGAVGFALEPGACAGIQFDGVEVAVARRDQVGEPGYELIVAYHNAAIVWEKLLGADQAVPPPKGQRRVRPVGWYAFNIARIEAGTPLFNIDFGPTNLPHETGILDERVSFTKGCYLGQEIVARMQNLGKPKQLLVGLRVNSDLLPIAGAQVFALRDDGSMGDEIGMVTSSSLSPMLGAAPIAFAMLKTTAAPRGTSVLVNAEGGQVRAVVSPLRFWPPVAEATIADATKEVLD